MLQKETFQFLEELKQNNNREWFQENKSWYEKSRADVENLVSQMIQAIVPFDPEAGQREAKKCIFRIYKDTRFSKDKTPYKTNFGVIFGTKDSGYYLHIDPDQCFLACGYYMPTPEQLKKIRKGIYDDYEHLRSILDNKSFKKELGDLYCDEDMLQRVPNGFDKESPAADYMKLKRFYVMKNLSQEQLTNDGFVAYASEIFKLMYPLKKFLNHLVSE